MSSEPQGIGFQTMGGSYDPLVSDYSARAKTVSSIIEFSAQMNFHKPFEGFIFRQDSTLVYSVRHI